MGRNSLAESLTPDGDRQQGARVLGQPRRCPQIALVVAVLLGWTGSGCSLLFVKGPPERALPHEPLRCTKDYVLPAVDGILAGLQAAGTVLAISQNDEYYQRHNLLVSRTANIAVGTALTALFATSMGMGIDRVSRCKEAD